MTVYLPSQFKTLLALAQRQDLASALVYESPPLFKEKSRAGEGLKGASGAAVENGKGLWIDSAFRKRESSKLDGWPVQHHRRLGKGLCAWLLSLAATCESLFPNLI